MAEHAFAKAQDNKGRLHWLMAETEDEIQDYCDNYHSATKGMQLDLFEASISSEASFLFAAIGFSIRTCLPSFKHALPTL